jgi:hypothetical protein
MNIKQVRNIILILITVIILLTAGIGITLLLKGKRGESTKYTTAFGTLSLPIDINLTQEENIQISFMAHEDNIKQTNKVYRINTGDDYYPSKTLAESVANNLKLKSDSNIESELYTYATEDGSVSLTLDEAAKSIKISFSEGVTSVKPSLPTEKELQELAKEKLEEIGLWPYSEEYITSFRYYYAISYSYYETDSKDNATLVGVNFSSKIDELPLIASRINTGEIEVLLDSNKQILKITYSYRPISEDIYATYPLKSVSGALSKAGSYEGEIISTFEAEVPESVTIDNVILAYKIELKDQDYLQPVYIFEGVDNNDEIVTIIVPAIDDQYLINPTN